MTINANYINTPWAIRVRCTSWTYLHKQQLSELPSMTVFQVLKAFTAITML